MKLTDIFNRNNKPENVEKAQDEYNQIQELKEKLDTKKKNLTSKIKEFENKAGNDIAEKMLNGKDITAEVGQELAELKSELEAVNKALQTADKALKQVEANLWYTQAENKRKEAEKKRQESEKLQNKVNEILKEVEELQGVGYKPKREVSKKNAGIGVVKKVKVPKTAALLNQADKLEKEARKLEKKAEKQSNSISPGEAVKDIEEAI